MTTIIHKFGRFNAMLIAGGMATLLLFYLMQLLIFTEFTIPDSVSPRVNVEIYIPEPELVVTTVSPKPEKVEKIEPPPPLDRNVVDSGDNVFIPAIFVPPVIDNNPGGEGTNFTQGNALALVQVRPTYPPRALERGIEGYIVIEFDINETGQVVDPRVLYAEPSGVFERSALRALERWKYSPKIVDGKAVRVYGVQERISFTMEN
ncbi:energy transducer TonB [Gammaproteobacteria bacterium]|nr:energy transducer TonB [Gammaproteobacteria bacterium]